MNALKIQGGIFSVCALLCAAASAGLPKWDAQTELILVTVLIIALGVPHGALDTVFGKERFGLTSLGAWLRFTALYLLLVVAVVGLWYYAPGVFLAGFLVIESPKAGSSCFYLCSSTLKLSQICLRYLSAPSRVKTYSASWPTLLGRGWQHRC